jgi:hypothetical protein
MAWSSASAAHARAIGWDEALGSQRRAPREGDGGLELRLGRSREGDWAGTRRSGRGVGLRARVKVARSSEREGDRVGTRRSGRGVGVIEPPKIILYYRLSRSTYPLSNNKELFCRFYRVKPGESLTTGSRYALSPHEGGTKV